ncbi:MAG: CAP domain-containing protein [Pseudomonadota bacterium]
MPRKSCLLISTALLVGCAANEMPLIDQAEQASVVVPERNIPAGQLQTLDEFAALERTRPLEAPASQAEQSPSEPTIPAPAAPSQAPVPVAQVVTSDGPLIMAASQNGMLTEVNAPTPVVVATAPAANVDVSAEGRTGADALTAAQARYESTEGENVSPARAAAGEPAFFEADDDDNMSAPETAEPSAPVIMADAVVAAEGRSGADALTAAQARYEPETQESQNDSPQVFAEEPVTEERDTPPAVISGNAAPQVVASTDGAAAVADGEVSQLLAAERAVAAINAYRTENGLSPLAYSDELSKVARAHVVDLAARGEVSALDRNGQGIGDRLKSVGYESKQAGSLVSGGYATIEAALESWQKNTVQRSRLLMENADEMGFAIISDRTSTYGIYIETIIAGG